jgi:hypothetical protein
MMESEEGITKDIRKRLLGNVYQNAVLPILQSRRPKLQSKALAIGIATPPSMFNPRHPQSHALHNLKTQDPASAFLEVHNNVKLILG